MTAAEPDDHLPWADLRAEVRQALDSGGIEDTDQISRWLAEEASGLVGSDWVLHDREPATVGGVNRARDMVRRVLAGEPVQYVIGHWPFRTLDLMVDHRVLIPRPETEVMVGAAMELLSEHPADALVVDLGTGSGAIGLSMAVERPGTQVVLTDIDDGALAVARANLAGLGSAGRTVQLRQGSWFDALDPQWQGGVHLLVSNPPYVDPADMVDPGVTDWEPHGALFADDAGFADVATVIGQAPRWLAPAGYLVIEMDPSQTRRACDLATEWGEATVGQDLAGRDRFVVIRRR